MKHILPLFGLLLFTGISLKSQNRTPSEVPMGSSSLGIYGSMNYQNINGKDPSGNALKNSLVLRFNAGINYEIPIAPEFFLQPGIQFVTKGTKGSVSYTDNTGNHNITREIFLSYVEIPVNMVFKPAFGTGHLVLGFGPYYGYAIGGKAKFSGAPTPQDSKIQFEKSSPTSDANDLLYFKRADMGANFFAGYELGNGINLLLNTQLGLININSKTNSKMMNKNTGFGLTLGYRF